MMASAANVAPTSNLTSTNPNSVAGQKDVPNRTTMKSSGSAKPAERARKESPVDTGRRPQPKAWTAGSNPATQRSTPAGQMNGSNTTSKATSGPKANLPKEAGMTDKHGHDRLRYILAAAIGLSAISTTKSGDKFEGIFAGFLNIPNGTKISLKMAKKMSSQANQQINGVATREAVLIGTAPDHAITFDFKDIADLVIPDFCLPEGTKFTNGAGTSFQTDADISGNANKGQRTLQRWEPEGSEGADFSLEANSTVQWDQFETHNQMFGDKSTYDEKLYTIEIDRKAPGYRQRELEAARIAREIENSTSTNAHVQEERNQISEQNHDNDEESKYSGVQRDDNDLAMLANAGSNKYTPPARRAPTAVPTVPGAPVDSAIISAQLSRPDIPKQAPPKGFVEKTTLPADPANSVEALQDAPETQTSTDVLNKSRSTNATAPVQPKSSADNPTDDVENKVLDQFRQFANAERARIAERRRAQASQDRTAKLNDLLRFSKTFKLKTPIPTDLVGILAKDPAKQEAIIERAQKDHEDAKSTIVPPSTVVQSTPAANISANPSTAAISSAKPQSIPKFDASQVPPPIPDRFNKGRAGYTHSTTRNERQIPPSQPFTTRGAPPFTQRTSSTQERKVQAPAPISMIEGRAPSIGPGAVESALTSPQRSNVHTPTSAAATKMNARAMEFRPTAPTFNPPGSSNAPSSPASVQRTASISRPASPSSFFGSRKPRPSAERPSVSANFNPIKRMKQETKARKAGDKTDEPIKDYPFNGGIPNAYHTGPVWTVKDENKDRTYLSAFERPRVSASPSGNRAASNGHVPYQGQVHGATNGNHPHLSTPQHNAHAGHPYLPQFDDHRMHIQGGSPPVFASPAITPRQMSNISSPMSNQTQLAFGQPSYYGTLNGQVPLQMRQYPTTPAMMHVQPGASMMVSQASNGPYMTVPQGYNQMQMYSPSQPHVYPQQNGYPSPSRGAPMMMQQGSQQSHHGGQPIVYAMPSHSTALMYGQQGQLGMIRGGYGGPQVSYGSSPHQAHHMQQRAMSSGYGQKALPQGMQQGQGPPSNAPQQPAAYTQMEMPSDDAK